MASRSFAVILPACLLIVTLLCLSAFCSELATSSNTDDDDDDDNNNNNNDDGDDNNDDDDVIETPTYCSHDRLSTLDQLIVVFRHGDRTPEDIFPTDINKEEAWPLGYGQLTERGILRSYELGQWFRSCYRSHLSDNLSTRRVYVRSTNYERTMMSLKAHLAGAYPQIKQGRDFQIHTVPVKSDPILRGHKNCPRFHELGEEIDSTAEARKILDADFDFLNMVREKSGLNLTNILRPTLIVADSVLVELENNLPVVGWLNKDSFIDKLKRYAHLAFELYYNNAEMSKIVGGPLLQEIIDKMKERASGFSKYQHVLYSGHSTVMGGLLGSLGTINNLEPPYAAAIIFELHNVENSYIVKTYYRNSTSEDPHPLEIAGCDSQEDHGCTLEEFQTALVHRVSNVQKHPADCALKSPSSKNLLIDDRTAICSSSPHHLSCGATSTQTTFSTAKPDGVVGTGCVNKSNPSSILTQQIVDNQYSMPTLGLKIVSAK